MRAPPKAKVEKPRPTNFNSEHPTFYAWWKKHRYSGYVEDGEGHAHWNMPPRAAWHVDRYRVEFSIDTLGPYRSRHEYCANEIEKWARDQEEMEEYVKGDYGKVPSNQFDYVISNALLIYRDAIERLEEEANHGKEN